MLDSLLNNVNAYIFVKNCQGKYIYVNQKVAELFEKPIDEILGKDDSEFFDLTHYQTLKENDQKVLSERVTIESEEETFVKALNSIRVYKTTKSPLFENGELIGLYGVSTDITEMKLLQDDLKRKENLLNVVLNNVDAHIYMKDSNRNFLYVNNKVADLFGYDADFIAGKRDSSVLPQETADHFWQSDKQVFERNEKTVAHEVVEDNGQRLHYQSVKIPFEYENGQQALIGFSTDVTELYNLKESFEQLAVLDHLTGLNNRRYFEEQSIKEFNRAQRHNSPLSIISIDIDNFKNINDTYGHPVGDQVLIELSKNLKTIVRDHDIVARMGGEEFSILLPNTFLNEAKVIAERIRVHQLNQGITGCWGQEIFITLSLGVAQRTNEHTRFEDMFSIVDKALYQAKNEGRNRIKVYA
ncbi:diguanylate cyclase [Thalassotalea euphylliae]|uniref:sensor domain-containing diguanylate cyclase n=1 Tax=Thalassotalea euphylliae TaxID=1655234 RepID=UPI00362970B4